jgi:CDP-paratose 2-epimerase
MDGARTLYGASKLAAELLVCEYAESFGLSTVVNRLGVVAGPWQMGKVDQASSHAGCSPTHFKRPLS